MKNTKLMLIAVGAVFAIAGFAAGCDETATTCETDEDCDTEAGEVCDVAEGECQIACATDADCEDQFCCTEGDVPSCKDECGGGAGGSGSGGGGGGGDVCPAGEGLSASDGLCHPTCDDVADCYDFSAYCASDSLCYDVDVFATCARVQGLPGLGASAPLIFDPGQDTIGTTAPNLCTKAPATCTNNGNVCQFSFQYHDPDGDVASSHGDLYNKIKFIDANGAKILPYDVVEASGNTLFILGCFDEFATSISGGVVVLDNANNQSNPLCLEGSAP